MEAVKNPAKATDEPCHQSYTEAAGVHSSQTTGPAGEGEPKAGLFDKVWESLHGNSCMEATCGG